MVKRTGLVCWVISVVAVCSCMSSGGDASSSSDAGGGTESGSGAVADAAAECSNGPVYGRGFQGYERADDARTYQECTPHCGYTGGKIGGFFYADALPSGSCSGTGSPCSMMLGVTCCGEATRGGSGINHQMRCDCVNGNWKCIIAAQGGGACECTGQDASAGD